MENEMSIENPVWGFSDTGLVHVVEAPPAAYSFFPEAACGNGVIISERRQKSEYTDDVECCQTCENLTGTGSAQAKTTTKPVAVEKPADE